MKNIMISMFLVFVSFFFISCGGEGPDDPIDTDPVDDTVVVDDNEPTDEDLADNEPMDDVTDETPDDDGLNDNEPTDNDTAPLTCDQDPTCQKICKNFLDLQGKWNNIDPDDVGSVDITLGIKEEKCEIKMVGQWTATWYGLDFPLDPFVDGYDFYISKKGQNLLIEVKDGSEIVDWKEYSK